MDTLEIHKRSDVVTDKTIEFLDSFLERPDRKPLFLLVWTIDPHDPYIPHESVKDTFEVDQFEPINTDVTLIKRIRNGELTPTPSQLEYIKCRYDQEILFNDLQFGRLMDYLKAKGVYDDAFILFTGDHGEEFMEHGGVGHGLTLYPEQVDMPLVIKWRDMPVGRSDKYVQHVDLMPTVLDIVGVGTPYPLDGTSLLKSVPHSRRVYMEEELDGNKIRAVIDPNMGIRYYQNLSVRRPPEGNDVPKDEFAMINSKGEQNLADEGIQKFMVQHMYGYPLDRLTEFSYVDAEMSQEMDERLKGLGYVR
jgi:arylsulfatase A-like enzyme